MSAKVQTKDMKERPKHKWEAEVILYMKDIVEGSRLVSSGTREDPVAGSCVYENELPGCINGREFPD
jgi:hypothetical protein